MDGQRHFRAPDGLGQTSVHGDMDVPGDLDRHWSDQYLPDLYIAARTFKHRNLFVVAASAI